jgi:hypothetical protein
MKKIIFIILFLTILFPQNSKKQLPKNFNIETSELRYEQVVSIDSEHPKNVLYDKLQRFVVHNYNSSNDVVQLNDKEGGNIIVRGNSSFTVMMGLKVWVPHTLDIKVKDGRYKYTLVSNYNINSKSPLQKHYFVKLKKQNKNWIIKSDESLQSLIMRMKNYVKNDTVTDEEDW